jgi:hypothetical protein
VEEYYTVIYNFDDEVGRACSMDGRNEKYLQNLGRKTEGKRPHLRPRLYRRIILEWILGNRVKCELYSSVSE